MLPEAGAILVADVEHHLLRIGGEAAQGSRPDRRERPRRKMASEAFVVAHELSHILLGHVGSGETAEIAQERVDQHWPANDYGFSNQSQREEATADLFGFHEIMVTTFTTGLTMRKLIPLAEKDRLFIAILTQCLEGAAIATLGISLVSSLGGMATGTGTHPRVPAKSFVLFRL
ncbi:hypothetical protein ACRAKI_21685 [Saccharothrix isguenensis]